MRVVTYARVSTIGQETEGQSLQNQERAFSRALDARGWTRVRAYREAASAGTVEGRAEFTRMMAELVETKPDCILVDTLDRFTRNVKDGLVLLDEMHARGVRLLPLDWRRDTPIDLNDDRDWADVMEEFTSAERERRKIRRRVLRSYEGRRERGATTHTKVPFGVVKLGDRLAPHPERAWIVREVDRRILAGESMGVISAWVKSIDPAAWKTRTGIMLAARNRTYVVAGLRTADEQAALETQLDQYSARYGMSRRVYELEFSGVFRCECGRLMHASGVTLNGKRRERVICDRRNKAEPGHCVFIYAERVTESWRKFIDELSAPGAVERWAATAQNQPARRALERRLAKIDQDAAALKERRDRALDLLADRDPGVVRQVRAALGDLDRDESALWAAREAVLGELAAVPAPRTDAATLAATLVEYRRLYDEASVPRRNALNRALCTAIGSHPVIRRIGRGGRGSKTKVKYVVDWPELSGLRTART